MRSFNCRVCGNLLIIENSLCVACDTAQGYSPAEDAFLPVDVAAGRARDGGPRQCADLADSGCNWLVDDDHPEGRCVSCRLTRTRPNQDDAEGMAAWALAETAKRRLVYQLLDLQLPLVPLSQDANGLAFDLLSSVQEPVTTGHADGVVTIDLAEGRDAHREAMRVQLGEAYRTMLGHLRHEVGHYYWQVLVGGLAPAGTVWLDATEEFRKLFGDERADYSQALERHYGQGAPPNWGEEHVSAYATAHPWEDWAESFAHYLHIRDTLQTAAAYGMSVSGPVDAPGSDPTELPAAPPSIQTVIDTWLPLSFALNAVNRSMGKDDLYPFVLAPPVVAKLGFVHWLMPAPADWVA